VSPRDLEFIDMFLSVIYALATVFIDMVPYNLVVTGKIFYITLYYRTHNDGTSWFIRSVDMIYESAQHRIPQVQTVIFTDWEFNI
jgi:hypothetical protein